MLLEERKGAAASSLTHTHTHTRKQHAHTYTHVLTAHIKSARTHADRTGTWKFHGDVRKNTTTLTD